MNIKNKEKFFMTFLLFYRTKELCDGEKDLSLAETCGRPLGFSFDTIRDFYILLMHFSVFLW